MMGAAVMGINLLGLLIGIVLYEFYYRSQRG